MARKPAPDVSFLESPRTTPAARPSTLFTSSTNDSAPAREIALAQLQDNPYQPRQTMNAEELDQLAEVIGAQGFQGVLVGRPHPTLPGMIQLAFGHRRREAARRAGLATIPVQVRDLDDRDMVEMAVTENIQRADLTPLDEGRTYLLMQAQFALTQEEVAARVGKTRGYVADRLRLAHAPADVQAFLEEKPDSIRAAASLVQIADPVLRAELMEGLRTGRLTTNDLPQARRTLTGPAAETLADPPPAAAPDAPADDRQHRARVRADNLRLETAIQSLTAFERRAAARGGISLQEFTNLARLRELVEGLYVTYSPPA
ncbi:MAG: ParB/RepB/Spo0J family partition protein [Chloroflexota bacterium]|nr:ParB/RepB/Spo0J family partition protein [Chloroflexota bacterium]